MNIPLLRSNLLQIAPAAALMALATTLLGSATARAQDTTAAAVPTITVNIDQVKGPSSPILYGMMTEDINYCIDGGLYGELLGNRTFQEPDTNPKRWSIVQDPGAAGSMDFDKTEKYNDAQPVSLKIAATAASDKMRFGVANEGYWGIPVKPNTTYHASFYAKADAGFTGPITVALSSTTQPVTYAMATVSKLTGAWQKYELTLKTGAEVKPTKDANFLIWTTAPGTVWISQPSLFPPTYNNRPNGMRPDLMDLLAGLHPGVPALSRRQLPRRQYHRIPALTGKKPLATLPSAPAIIMTPGATIPLTAWDCSSFVNGARICTSSRCWEFLPGCSWAMGKSRQATSWRPMFRTPWTKLNMSPAT